MSELQNLQAVTPRSVPAKPEGGSPLSEQVRSLRLPPPESAGSQLAWFPWLLCLVLAGTTGWLGYERYWAPTGSAAQATPTTGDAQTPGQFVTKPDAVKSVGEIALESKGYVIAAHQILVSPQVSGRLLTLNIEEGRRATKGEVLGEIESTEYRADVARATAALALSRNKLRELENGNRPEEIEQSQAELAEAEASLKQLEAEWKRNSQLVASNVVTEQEFELTESRYLAIQRRVERLRFALKLMKDGPRIERIEVARAEVQQAEAELEKAQWRLDNCTIRAPISGTILKKNAEEGNIVNPIAFNGSYSICDMADLSDLEVSLDIQERDLSRIRTGQRCKVRADAFPERIYQGIVSRLMPIADRAKGAVQVRVKLTVPPEEEGVYLKPEMGAVVSFLNEPSQESSPSQEPSTRKTAEETPPGIHEGE